MASSSLTHTQIPPAGDQSQAQSPLLLPAPVYATQGQLPGAAPVSSVIGYSQTADQQSMPIGTATSIGFMPAHVLSQQLSQPPADVASAQQDALEQLGSHTEQQQGLLQDRQSAHNAVLQQGAAAAAADSGQQLTDSPPSLAWPGGAASTCEPDRQQSLSASVPSRQASATMPPVSTQASAVAPLLSRQPSAGAPVLSQQAAAEVLPTPSRQTSAVAQVPSRQQSAVASALIKQGSAVVPLPSRQGSATVTPPTRQPSAMPVEHATSMPDQAAANSPSQGLEQAWAALLPSLLAESNKRQAGSGAAHTLPTDLADVLLPVHGQRQQHDVQQQQDPALQRNGSGHGGHAMPSVQDILQTWAPVPKPPSTGTPPAQSHCSSTPCISNWVLGLLYTSLHWSPVFVYSQAQSASQLLPDCLVMQLFENSTFAITNSSLS